MEICLFARIVLFLYHKQIYKMNLWSANILELSKQSNLKLDIISWTENDTTMIFGLK